MSSRSPPLRMLIEPQFLGLYGPADAEHVRGQARLADAIAARHGVSADARRTIVAASWLHEFGRIGFDDDLRDGLVALCARFDLTNALSRTWLIAQGYLPDWPTPAAVVDELERHVRRAWIGAQDDANAADEFQRLAADAGVDDGALSERQRANLRLLYGHDDLLFANIETHAPEAAAGDPAVLPTLHALERLLARSASARDGGDPIMVNALVMLAADQLEITNSFTRRRRSRRTPVDASDHSPHKTWRAFHLADEAIAGRDASVPSVHRMLVQRLPDELRPSGRALFATIGALLTRSAAHESGVCGLLEDARRAPVPETEFDAVGRWLARENGT